MPDAVREAVTTYLHSLHSTTYSRFFWLTSGDNFNDTVDWLTEEVKKVISQMVKSSSSGILTFTESEESVVSS